MIKIGIIGAMEEEVDTLKAEVENPRVVHKANMDFVEGIINHKPVVVVKCGIGKVNAGICTQILIDDFKVSHVINTGVGGSLRNEINIGDIVVSTDAVQHDYDVTPLGYKRGEIPDLGVTFFPADPTLRSETLRAIQEVAPEIKGYEGRICSGDQFIGGHEQKQRIIEEFQGFCCEMEGAAIAQAAWLNGVPFVVIRAISDKADDSGSVSYREFEEAAARHCASIVNYMISHFPEQTEA